MKLVYVFGKEGRLRFLSHLDLQRFLMRALNRTDLQIAYSKGFNPHPLLSLAGALAMGYESDYEVFELRIEGSVSKEYVHETMKNALPEELPIKDVFFAEDNHPSYMSLVRMSDFTITPAEDFEAVKEAALKFLEMDSYMGIRRTKTGEREVDARKLCKEMSISICSLKARLMLTEQETLKPDLLMETLCKIADISVPQYRVRRNALLGCDDCGNIKLITDL